MMGTAESAAVSDAGQAAQGPRLEPARDVRSTPRRLSSTSMRLLQRWAREPFIHFALLGALTFVVHDTLSTPAPSERILHLSADKQRELQALFEQRQHRPPSAAERGELVQRWFADEVLFREGLRLDLVHTDSALRDQIIARMRGLVQASVPASTPSAAELARFYAEHRTDYLVPEAISFTEYLVRSGSDATDSARYLLRLLQAGSELTSPPLPPPTEYVQRSEAQLAALYGPELAHKLFGLPEGSWQQLRSNRGVHLVRITTRTPAREPGPQTLHEQLLVDQRTAITQRVIESEIARLEAQWQLQVEGAP